jgi:hypothetical protein
MASVVVLEEEALGDLGFEGHPIGPRASTLPRLLTKPGLIVLAADIARQTRLVTFGILHFAPPKTVVRLGVRTTSPRREPVC